MTDPKPASDRLNAGLAEAVDVLRGAVDPNAQKEYFFGVLFLKRVNDRFQEEVDELVERGVDREDAENDRDFHPLFVPAQARWAAISMASQYVGETLNSAAAALEEANPALAGALVSLDFADEQKLGAGRERDALLRRLIDHFSEMSLTNREISRPDTLGQACAFLLGRFAEALGRRGGDFYTPPAVARLVVAILDPTEGQRICDPTCGTGGMLIAAAQHVAATAGKKPGADTLNLTLHGQEKNPRTWALCKLNLLLHDLPDARIEMGDTLRQPRLAERGQLLRYDQVIANPPFGLDNWGAADAANDSYHRFDFGLPPKNLGDFAFVQHAVATLRDTGVAGIVVPLGVLFRGSGDGQIRRKLLEKDWFEGVIGLPENLFFGTPIPAAILVLNRKKRPERRGKVLFVHAAAGYASHTNQNQLREQDICRIVEAWRAWTDEARFSRVVPLEEIFENDGNLNISRYVETLEPEEPVDLAALYAEVKRLEAARDEAERRLDALLGELGIGI